MSCKFPFEIVHMSHLMTKPTKWHVRPAKTQIRVFAVRSMGSLVPKVSSCGQRRLWSDWADAQADLSLRWAHSHFVRFVMRRLILQFCTISYILASVSWPCCIIFYVVVSSNYSWKDGSFRGNYVQYKHKKLMHRRDSNCTCICQSLLTKLNWWRNIIQ